MISNAIVLARHGGPEALVLRPVEIGEPGHGELRIRQTFAGVNFHDIYVRTGEYMTLSLPGIPGIEATGRIEACGPGTDGFAAGDRIVYVSGRYGAYTSRRILPAHLAVRLPDDIDEAQAASMFVRGLTVMMLTNQVRAMTRADVIVVHAAASGVGRLLAQYASQLGATVIGTVGSAEKIAAAQASGCYRVVVYREAGWAARVLGFTDGRGVDVVYDSIGRDTIEGSFDCLRPCGHLVAFGQSSGPVEPIPLSRLAKRSTTITRPILFDYVAERTALERMASDFFDAVRSGAMSAPDITILPLSDAAQAHRILEGRAASGSLVLKPDGEF